MREQRIVRRSLYFFFVYNLPTKYHDSPFLLLFFVSYKNMFLFL
mgnify:CR=1 FL=1